MKREHLILSIMAAVTGVAAGGFWLATSDADAGGEQSPLPAPPQSGASGEMSAAQIQRLGIQTALAEASSELPIGTVPAIVTLPPEARVAVTAPFAGTVIRLHVIAGQAVTKGQALAVIRSREPVQFGADLARARARLGSAQAAATRTGQLAREGIIAESRADEARALVQQAQVDVAEGSRVLAQAGSSANGETVLRSPITGRVALVGVQAGGPVDGMTAPFVVENTASLMLDLQIPERLAGSVFPGMAVEVTLPDATIVSGSIVAVGASIDPANRAILARAKLEAAPSLMVGKPVMALLKGGLQQNGVRIPAAAMTRFGDKDVVFVRTKKGFAIRHVVIAGRSRDRLFLASGLKAGDSVAISGITELKAALGGD